MYYDPILCVLGYGTVRLLFYGTDIPEKNTDLGKVFFLECTERPSVAESAAAVVTASLVVFPLPALQVGNWPVYTHTLINGKVSHDRVCAPQLWEHKEEVKVSQPCPLLPLPLFLAPFQHMNFRLHRQWNPSKVAPMPLFTSNPRHIRTLIS